MEGENGHYNLWWWRRWVQDSCHLPLRQMTRAAVTVGAHWFISCYLKWKKERRKPETDDDRTFFSTKSSATTSHNNKRRARSLANDFFLFFFFFSTSSFDLQRKRKRVSWFITQCITTDRKRNSSLMPMTLVNEEIKIDLHTTSTQ